MASLLRRRVDSGSRVTGRAVAGKKRSSKKRGSPIWIIIVAVVAAAAIGVTIWQQIAHH